MACGLKLAASSSTVVVPAEISAAAPPMIPATPTPAPVASAITQSSGDSRRMAPSRVTISSPGRPGGREAPASQAVEVVGVVGLAELEHHVIGHVDDRAYGPHPGQGQPPGHQGRHGRIGHPFDDRAGETGAQVGGVAVHRHRAASSPR